MKQLFIVSIFFVFLTSCKKSTTNGGGLPSAAEKIYFDGSPSAIFGTSEIFTINGDGTGEKQLTDVSGGWVLTTKGAGSVMLTPDAQKIIFLSSINSAVNEFFSMNVDGTGITKIIENNVPGSFIRDPYLFNNNGQKVVFCQEFGTGAGRHAKIMIANIDGTGIAALTNYPADNSCYWPCANPTGNTIVYSNNIASGQFKLFAMNADGNNKRQLSSGGPAIQAHAQFSPDGSKIVFSGYVGIASEIFIMDANGANTTQLTFYGKNSVSWGATFSKDGKTIYYSSDESPDGISQLYKMNSDGSGKTKFTSGNTDKFRPCIK